MYDKKKLTLCESKMIRIMTDEEVHESDVELIELFGVALVDRDKSAMKDLLYVMEDKLLGECICLEEDCYCSGWS
jgi:hypothetical protein|tara:strand:- start:182 stop:406 length:225 start_codon:yes stop_codon:yes gene_type:complete